MAYIKKFNSISALLEYVHEEMQSDEFISVVQDNSFIHLETGVLLIGVEDNRNIMGLEATDYLTFNKPDKKDEFLKHFDNLFGKLLGNGYNSLVDISIEDIEEKKVAKVCVAKKASEPVFLKQKGKMKNFISDEAQVLLNYRQKKCSVIQRRTGVNNVSNHINSNFSLVFLTNEKRYLQQIYFRFV